MRLFLAVLLFGFAITAWADSLPEIFGRISPSVAALYSQTEEGNLEFNCTLTAVDRHEKETVLLTAHHCVRKGTAYLVSFDGRQFYSARVWQIPHDELDGRRYPRKFEEPGTDMALFLSDLGDDSPDIVELGDDSNVSPGTPIAVIGFPLGVTKVRYEGIIAGQLDRPGDSRHGYLILQSFGAPGNSGSAVVDLDNMKVVGVLVSGKSGRAGLPVIFATPIGYQKYLCDVNEPAESDACKPSEKAEVDSEATVATK